MEIEIKKTKDYERRLEIHVPPTPVNKKINELYNKYQRELRINGFRRGKIPLSIIKERFGKAIQEEAINFTIRETFKDALEEKELSPITQGVVEDTKFDEKEGLFFKIRFEVFPEITVKDYKGIEIKVPSVSVSKEEITLEIEKLRKLKANYIPVYTRGSMVGDMVIVDYEILREERGVLRKEKISNYAIILGAKGVPEEITKCLLNVTQGERRKTSIRYPTDFKDPSLRGQLVEYEFVVREVKEEKLPPLSDEFAKEFGFESMSELTEGIEKQIKKEKEREADDLAKTQIINSLIDTHPFEPPRSLVNAYLQPLIKEAKEMTEDTRKELEKIAIWYAKRDVLLKEIIKIEKIDISEEELKEKIEGLDKYKGLEYNRAVKKMKDEGEFDLFVGQLKRNKVLNFLLKHARRRDEEPVSANGD